MIKTIKSKLVFLLAVMLATVVGSIGTAVVMAAIPAGDGTISGCYGKVAGNLRVINAEGGANCTSLENPISWNASGSGVVPDIAFFGTTDEGTLDTNYSKNISDFKIVEGYYSPTETTNGSTLCIQVPFAPRFAQALPKPWSAGEWAYHTGKGSDLTTFIESVCGEGFNVLYPINSSIGLPVSGYQIMIQ